MEFSGDRLRGLEEKYAVRIKYLQETASTNLLASAKEHRHGDLIIASKQSAGKGQRGNVWISEPGMNLTFSIVLEPRSLPAEMQFYISKIISLSVVDTLDNYGLKSEIKWPNDIYVSDSKIAGILIENDIMGAHIKRSIAGVGLNVNQKVFDPSLPNPASVVSLTGRELALADVLDVFLCKLGKWMDKLGASALSEIDHAYKSGLYRIEGQHTFSVPGGEIFNASIKDVMPTGELILLQDHDEERSYLFKEVEFVV